MKYPSEFEIVMLLSGMVFGFLGISIMRDGFRSRQEPVDTSEVDEVERLHKKHPKMMTFFDLSLLLGNLLPSKLHAATGVAMKPGTAKIVIGLVIFCFGGALVYNAWTYAAVH